MDVTMRSSAQHQGFRPIPAPLTPAASARRDARRRRAARCSSSCSARPARSLATRRRSSGARRSEHASAFQLLRQLNRLTGGRLRSPGADRQPPHHPERPRRQAGATGRRSSCASTTPSPARPRRCSRRSPPFVESRRGSDRAREALVRHPRALLLPTGRPPRPPAGSAPGGASTSARSGRPQRALLRGPPVGGDDLGASSAARPPLPAAADVSLQLGSYSYEDRLIRLHRALDQPGSPPLRRRSRGLP